jgi:hypothetical protein
MEAPGPEAPGPSVTSGRLAWVGVAAAALSVAFGASGSGAPTPARPAAAVGKRVFVVGDSLAIGTKPYLGRYLHGWRVRTSATISKHAPQGASELARRSRHLPPVVVASLGTNDDPHAVSSFEHAVRTSLRAVGKHGCLVWPNIVRPTTVGRTSSGLRSAVRPTPDTTASSTTSPRGITTCGWSTGSGSPPTTAAGSTRTASTPTRPATWRAPRRSPRRRGGVAHRSSSPDGNRTRLFEVENLAC